MANFNVCFVNSIGIVTDNIVLHGRKIGKIHDGYNHYRMDMPNKYGIKLVIIQKDGWQGYGIYSTKAVPPHSHIIIYKLFK